MTIGSRASLYFRYPLMIMTRDKEIDKTDKTISATSDAINFLLEDTVEVHDI